MPSAPVLPVDAVLSHVMMYHYPPVYEASSEAGFLVKLCGNAPGQPQQAVQEIRLRADMGVQRLLEEVGKFGSTGAGTAVSMLHAGQPVSSAASLSSLVTAGVLTLRVGDRTVLINGGLPLPTGKGNEKTGQRYAVFGVLGFLLVLASIVVARTAAIGETEEDRQVRKRKLMRQAAEEGKPAGRDISVILSEVINDETKADKSLLSKLWGAPNLMMDQDEAAAEAAAKKQAALATEKR